MWLVAGDPEDTVGNRLLTSEEAVRRVRSAGIAVAPGHFVRDANAVEAAAGELDAGLLVVKAAGLNHKSDRGGVRLHLPDPASARTAADELLADLGPEALPLLVQQQGDGTEILIGIRRDAKLGPAVLVGTGGTKAEIEKDVAYMVAPVDRSDATRALRELRLWPILAGYRGSSELDVDALVTTIVDVSRLAVEDPHIIELDLNPVLVSTTGAVTVDVRIVVENECVEIVTDGPALDLQRLMSPRHIAVVGVSDDEHKTGSRLFRYLRTHGFEGRLDAIHPAGGEHEGQRRFRTLEELPHSPDLVCIAVPARAVGKVLDACLSVEAGGVIVHSSGFAEADEQGRELQRTLAAKANEARLPILGPNSMGLVRPAIGLTASISGGLEHAPRPGGTALLSGSGALGSCLATRLMGAGVGLSCWVHVGNEAQTGVADYLDWLVRDDRTDHIGLLLEDIKDGPALIEAGQRARAAERPVVAYDLVPSEEAREAALSHTGALLGSLELRRAVLDAAGIAVTASLQTLEDALRLLAAEHRPPGRRLAVVTFSGGACSIISHEATSRGISLPELPKVTADRIARRVPPYAAVRNPLDVSYEMISRPDDFSEVLLELVESQAYDALLVQFTTNADPYAQHTASAAIRVRSQARIPVYLSRFGAPHLAPLALNEYREAGVHLMDTPDRAIQAIAAVMDAVCPPTTHVSHDDH